MSTASVWKDARREISAANDQLTSTLDSAPESDDGTGRMIARIAILALLAIVAEPPVNTTAEATPELPSSRNQVAAALADVGKQYGLDAVRLQSHLMQNSLQAGALLSVGAGVGGTEQRSGENVLVLNLETGIVYNDADSDPASYPQLIWSDIVEPTLLQFRALDIPAPGLALKVSYQHASYDDRDELLRRLPSNPPKTKLLVFYLATKNIVDLANSRITASELLARTDITLDGEPKRIELPTPAAIEPPTPPPSDSFRLFPETPDS